MDHKREYRTPPTSKGNGSGYATTTTVCGLFVWCSLCVSMLTVSNALLMSSATVIVRSGGLFWSNPVAMVLFMLCSAVLVEWLFLKPCCVDICGILFVMYGSSVFSSHHHHIVSSNYLLPSLCTCLSCVVKL